MAVLIFFKISLFDFKCQGCGVTFFHLLVMYTYNMHCHCLLNFTLSLVTITRQMNVKEIWIIWKRKRSLLNGLILSYFNHRNLQI